MFYSLNTVRKIMSLTGGVKSASAKRPPTVKGRHSSRNGYMLVYQLQSLNTNATFSEITIDMLPERVSHYLSIDNHLLEEEIDCILVGKDKLIKDRQNRLDDIRECFTLLISLPDNIRSEACDWISTESLVKWFDNDISHDSLPICNSKIICSHHSMDPNKVDMAKLVPSLTVEKLFSVYGGDMRLMCKPSLCKECVMNRCFIEFNKARINEIDQQWKQYLKSNSVSHDGSGVNFWVNKVSLKQWRTFALNTLLKHADVKGIYLKEDDSREDESMECKKQAFHTDDELNNKLSLLPSISNTFDADENKFNEAVQCIHGNLCLEAKTRVLLPSNIWNRLVEIFTLGTFVEVADTVAVCQECRSKDAEDTELVLKNRLLAATQKSELLDLFIGKKRPNSNSDQLYIVPSSFVSDWRKFIRDPTKSRPLELVDNRSLLCCHDKCAFDLPYECDNSTNSCVTFVNTLEWSTIKRHFIVDLEIRRDFIGEQETLIPGICDECREIRRLNEFQSLFIYDSAPIFVQRVTELNFTIEHSVNGDIESCDSSSNLHQPLDECEVEVADINEQSLINDERKRKLGSSANEDSCQNVKVRKFDSVIQPRRSSRKRDKSTEKQFIVSSSQTLLQLKLELAGTYKVLKTDQHVYLNGRELTDDNATLQELQVQQNSVLLLKVDEPTTSDTIELSTDPRENGCYVAEKGFKGTLLGV